MSNINYLDVLCLAYQGPYSAGALLQVLDVETLSFQDNQNDGLGQGQFNIRAAYESQQAANIQAANRIDVYLRLDELSQAASVGNGSIVVSDGTRFTVGQTFAIYDGVHFEVFPITGISSNTLTFTGTLAHAYGLYSSVMPLRYSGIVTTRQRDAARGATMMVTTSGYARELADLVFEGDVGQTLAKECGYVMYQVIASYATQVDFTINAANFVMSATGSTTDTAGTKIGFTGSSKGTTLQSLFDSITTTANANTDGKKYAYWIDASRAFHFGVLPTTATVAFSVNGKPTGAGTTGANVTMPADGIADVISKYVCHDEDMTGVINTYYLTGGTDPSTKAPISTIVFDQNSVNQYTQIENAQTNSYITDATVLKNWGLGLLAQTAFPIAQWDLELSAVRSFVTPRTCIKVVGFDDSSTETYVPQSVVTRWSSMSPGGFVQVIKGSQLLPDPARQLKQYANEKYVQNAFNPPSSNLADRMVTAGLAGSVASNVFSMTAGTLLAKVVTGSTAPLTQFNVAAYTWTLPASPTDTIYTVAYLYRNANGTQYVTPQVITFPSASATQATAYTDYQVLPLWRLTVLNGTLQTVNPIGDLRNAGVTTSHIPAMPSGTTVSGATVVTGPTYAGVGGANPTVTFTFNLTISDTNWATWFGGYSIVAKQVANGAANDNDSVIANYFDLDDVSAVSYTNAISVTAPLASGANAFQIGILVYDQAGNMTAVKPFLVTTAQAIASTAMSAMPSGIKTSGPTVTSATVPTRIVGKGTNQQVRLPITLGDFDAKPGWLDTIFIVGRYNGDTDPSFVTAYPYEKWTNNGNGTISITANNFAPLGTAMDYGAYYTDQTGAKSATVYPANWLNVGDANGDFVDPGDGGALKPGKNPINVRNRISLTSALTVDTSVGAVNGNLPFANTDAGIQKITAGNLIGATVDSTTGRYVLPNVDYGAPTQQTYNLGVGANAIHTLEATFQRTSTAADVGFQMFTDYASSSWSNGYLLQWGGGEANVIHLYTKTSGTYAAIAGVAGPASDLLPHTIKVVVSQAVAGTVAFSVYIDGVPYIVSASTTTVFASGRHALSNRDGGGNTYVDPNSFSITVGTDALEEAHATLQNRNGIAYGLSGAPPYVDGTNTLQIPSSIRVTRPDGTASVLAPTSVALPSTSGQVFIGYVNGTASSIVAISRTATGAAGTGYAATLSSTAYEPIGAFYPSATPYPFTFYGGNSSTDAAAANVLVPNNDGTGYYRTDKAHPSYYLPIGSNHPEVLKLQNRNLVKNGNFQLAEALSTGGGWTAWGSITSHAQAGSFGAMTSEQLVAGSGSGIYQAIPVKPNTTYSFAILTYVGTSGGSTISRVLNNALSVDLSNDTQPTGSLPAGGFYLANATLNGARMDTTYAAWKLSAGQFASGNNSSVTFIIQNNGAAGSTFYLLGAMAWEGTKWQDYVDGDILPGSINNSHIQNVNLDYIGDGGTYGSLPLVNVAGSGTSKRALVDLSQSHINTLPIAKSDQTLQNRNGGFAAVSGQMPYVDSSNVLHFPSYVYFWRGSGTGASTYSYVPINSTLSLASHAYGAIFLVWSGNSAGSLLAIEYTATGAAGTGYANTINSSAYEVLGTFNSINGTPYTFSPYFGHANALAATQNVIKDNADGTGSIASSTSLENIGALLPTQAPTIYLFSRWNAGTSNWNIYNGSTPGASVSYALGFPNHARSSVAFVVNDVVSTAGTYYYVFAWRLSDNNIVNLYGPSTGPSAGAAQFNGFNDGYVPITVNVSVPAVSGSNSSGTPGGGSVGGHQPTGGHIAF